jgi:hypothetical protein
MVLVVAGVVAVVAIAVFVARGRRRTTDAAG